MSFKQWLQGLLFRKKDDGVAIRDQVRAELKQFGVDAIINKSLENRLNLLMGIEEIYAEKEPIERVNKMNYLVKIASMPWARPMDSIVMARVMICWHTLVKVMHEFNVIVDGEVNEERKERLRYLFDRFVKRESLVFGEIVISLSFSNRDVLPQSVTLIQPQGGIFSQGVSGAMGKVEPMYETHIGAPTPEERTG